MAVSIGKRKRKRDDDGSDAGSEDDGALKALFQKAFETKFKPLPQVEPEVLSDQNSEQDDITDGSEDSDEWDGLSDEDDTVQVISLDTDQSNDHTDDGRERRSFMSSKPPNPAQNPTKSTKPIAVDTEEDATEKANLKNDLALKRLLKESHLLDPSSFSISSKTSTPEGKSRLKSLDLRIQDLGAKQSIATQEKMPLSHRKGMASKASSRDEKRRRDARENGVVLEKAKSGVKLAKRRERSVGGPTVGRFKGGTLKLSSKDVRSIQGPKGWDGGRRKGRR